MIIRTAVSFAFAVSVAVTRTHLSLDKDSPTPRPVMPPTAGRIVEVPEGNGLHHRYDRAAA
jgi:hypothetical protein